MTINNQIVLPTLIASVLTLASCATSGPKTIATANAETSQKTCEVSFSMLPHKLTVHKLGEDRLSKLDGVRETFEGERVFIESFDSMNRAIIKSASSEQSGYEDVKIQMVFGGYEGFTSPSLSARFPANTQEQRDVVKKIGAALGYVYLQDSVLIQCDVLSDQDSSVVAYDMTENGVVDAINPDTLKSIYGMMIGQANGNLDLGFSYYEAEDRFSVLGFDKNGKESNALDGVIETIEALTQNSKQISLTKTPKWVSFPSNNWSNYPEGQNYLSLVDLSESVEMLNELQFEFIIQIDANLLE